jgi:GH35 family endo-1,4-beta-xylanase
VSQLITGEEWRLCEGGAPYQPDTYSSSVQTAQANIVKYRQREVAIRLTQAGKPLAHQTFAIEQVRNAFPFGEQTWGMERAISDSGPFSERVGYMQKRHEELFNAANCLCYWTENTHCDGSKTEDLLGMPRLDGFYHTVNWAAAAGLYVKGHPLFWSVTKALPKWLMRYDLETQWKFIEVRVRQLIAGTRGKVNCWDICNEAIWEPVMANAAKRHWPHMEDLNLWADDIARLLRIARSEDPDACYVVNDYGTEEDMTENTYCKLPDGTFVSAAMQRGRMLELFAKLGERNALPDGLGIQSHGAWQPHDRQMAMYDQYATAGVPLQVTEFWAHSDHLAKKGMPEDEIKHWVTSYVRDTLICAYGHPAVGAFFCWGIKAVNFTDTTAHRATYVYDLLNDLLNKQWKTRTNVTTDAEGVARFRGFFGTYGVRRTQQPIQGRRFEVQPGTDGVTLVNF